MLSLICVRNIKEHVTLSSVSTLVNSTEEGRGKDTPLTDSGSCCEAIWRHRPDPNASTRTWVEIAEKIEHNIRRVDLEIQHLFLLDTNSNRRTDKMLISGLKYNLDLYMQGQIRSLVNEILFEIHILLLLHTVLGSRTLGASISIVERVVGLCF